MFARSKESTCVGTLLTSMRPGSGGCSSVFDSLRSSAIRSCCALVNRSWSANGFAAKSVYVVRSDSLLANSRLAALSRSGMPDTRLSSRAVSPAADGSFSQGAEAVGHVGEALANAGMRS